MMKSDFSLYLSGWESWPQRDQHVRRDCAFFHSTWGYKGQLGHRYVFELFCLFLLRRTFSLAIYFLGKSHVEVSLAMCFWFPELPLAPCHPAEYSISFVGVFVLPILFHRSPATDYPSCLGAQVIHSCLHTNGHFPVFSEELIPYHPSMMRSVAPMNLD